MAALAVRADAKGPGADHDPGGVVPGVVPVGVVPTGVVVLQDAGWVEEQGEGGGAMLQGLEDLWLLMLFSPKGASAVTAVAPPALAAEAPSLSALPSTALCSTGACWWDSV
jgi:hypothetical protein